MPSLLSPQIRRHDKGSFTLRGMADDGFLLTGRVEGGGIASFIRCPSLSLTSTVLSLSFH